MKSLRPTSTSLTLVGLTALLIGACNTESPRIQPTPSAPSPKVEREPDPVPVSVTPSGPSELVPEGLGENDPTRRRRRMDLDQLDAAIRAVTGGIGWTERQGSRDVNLFEQLASTLGKPDYIQITEENLEPSAMFQKFLDDAARSVCDRLIQEEAQRPPEDRVFFVHADPSTTIAVSPDRVDRNLQALLLRFHGRHLAVDAPELEPWRWLVRSAEHVTSEPVEVWRTVCVGLFTHPDFYTY